MNIGVYKTIGGQDIIAKVIEEGIGWVILENVQAFRVIPSESGYSLKMVPFSPLMPTEQWKYSTSQFLAQPVAIPQALKDAYIKETTQIEIVSAMDMVGMKK